MNRRRADTALILRVFSDVEIGEDFLKLPSTGSGKGQQLHATGLIELNS